MYLPASPSSDINNNYEKLGHSFVKQSIVSFCSLKGHYNDFYDPKTAIQQLIYNKANMFNSNCSHTVIKSL